MFVAQQFIFMPYIIKPLAVSVRGGCLFFLLSLTRSDKVFTQVIFNIGLDPYLTFCSTSNWRSHFY